MEKQVIQAGVPETGGPFNLCVRHGDMLYISGLPPFEEEYCALLRAARARGEPPPPFPDLPFERQVRIVMDHMRRLLEEEFDRIYRTYFTSQDTLPARTRMQAGRTPMDCALEVEAIGYVPRR